MASGGGVHDRELLDALDALGCEPFAGTVWRVTWASRDALMGSAAGGRWHPAGSFEALSTSLDSDGALAEAYHHLSRAPVFSSLQMRIHRLQVHPKRTLILNDMATLQSLGIEESRFASMDHERTQAIGAAAYLLELDALLVPSARSASLNLVLFLDRLDPESSLLVVDSHDVNWPAWKERRRPPK